MDLFQLIIRLLAFAVTLYLLLEFIVACTVCTSTGIILMLLVCIIVIGLFLGLKRYDMAKCDKCKQIMPKNMFGIVKM
jgi:hypothetical protein